MRNNRKLWLKYMDPKKGEMTWFLPDKQYQNKLQNLLNKDGILSWTDIQDLTSDELEKLQKAIKLIRLERNKKNNE